MPPRGWIKRLKYLNRLHGHAGAIASGYILFKNQGITFALAHLQARQEQTSTTCAEVDSCEIRIQTQLKFKTKERLNVVVIKRSLCQTMIASAVFLLK